MCGNLYRLFLQVREGLVGGLSCLFRRSCFICGGSLLYGGIGFFRLLRRFLCFGLLRLRRGGLCGFLCLCKKFFYLFLLQFPGFQFPQKLPALFRRSHKKHIAGDRFAVILFFVCL